LSTNGTSGSGNGTGADAEARTAVPSVPAVPSVFMVPASRYATDADDRPRGPRSRGPVVPWSDIGSGQRPAVRLDASASVSTRPRPSRGPASGPAVDVDAVPSARPDLYSSRWPTLDQIPAGLRERTRTSGTRTFRLETDRGPRTFGTLALSALILDGTLTYASAEALAGPRATASAVADARVYGWIWRDLRHESRSRVRRDVRALRDYLDGQRTAEARTTRKERAERRVERMQAERDRGTRTARGLWSADAGLANADASAFRAYVSTLADRYVRRELTRLRTASDKATADRLSAVRVASTAGPRPVVRSRLDVETRDRVRAVRQATADGKSRGYAGRALREHVRAEIRAGRGKSVRLDASRQRERFNRAEADRQRKRTAVRVEADRQAKREAYADRQREAFRASVRASASTARTLLERLDVAGRADFDRVKREVYRGTRQRTGESATDFRQRRDRATASRMIQAVRAYVADRVFVFGSSTVRDAGLPAIDPAVHGSTVRPSRR
jgi:hypothetical protein